MTASWQSAASILPGSLLSNFSLVANFENKSIKFPCPKPRKITGKNTKFKTEILFPKSVSSLGTSNFVLDGTLRDESKIFYDALAEPPLNEKPAKSQKVEGSDLHPPHAPKRKVKKLKHSALLICFLLEIAPVKLDLHQNDLILRPLMF